MPSRIFIPAKRKILYDEDELKTAILLSKKQGQISDAEEDMISYVLEFKDTQVSEILTPRVDIKGIDITSSQEEVLKILKKEQHSKFPVFKESLDNIVGVLYAKDLFLQPEKNYPSLLREPIFIPESKKIDDEKVRYILEAGRKSPSSFGIP